MIKIKLLLFFTLIVLLQSCASGLKHYITADADRLMDGDKELRFISFNIPNLHLIEDNFNFKNTKVWRLPDEYEIRDALESIQQMGCNVARVYVLSVVMASDSPDIPRHVTGPNQFNEEAFRTLDKVLQVANEYQIRLILPLVDNWTWWGGIADYARFMGKEKSAFWQDDSVKELFKQTIKSIVNRRNVFTGKKYRDDKAILAWETGNELESPNAWVSEMAGYIKSVDPNHLVIGGVHETELRPETVEDPNVDILTTHSYQSGAQVVASIRKNRQMSIGKKPYFLGEFGFIPPKEIKSVLDAVEKSGISGALLWSLRYHNRDGGFYWHGEWTGNTAYHWPGFSSSNFQGEKNVMEMVVRQNAKIANKPLPPVEVPAPPMMLPAESPAYLAWRGSVGAESYQIERANQTGGPWQIIATAISDAEVAYRPLFADDNITVKEKYFYRVKAKNGAGISKPSNAIGPLTSAQKYIIDELQDLRFVDSVKGELQKIYKNSDKARGDINRMRGKPGTELIYRVFGEIKSMKVWTFFSKPAPDFSFLSSIDGEKFETLQVKRTDFYKKRPNYTDYYPVEYLARKIPAGSQFLKIIFHADAEISRAEIFYDVIEY